VTRGQLPQRAGSLGLNDSGAAAAVPPQGQGQGHENWSSRILEDKDFPWGQQHWTSGVFRFECHIQHTMLAHFSPNISVIASTPKTLCMELLKQSWCDGCHSTHYRPFQWRSSQLQLHLEQHKNLNNHATRKLPTYAQAELNEKRKPRLKAFYTIQPQNRSGQFNSSWVLHWVWCWEFPPSPQWEHCGW